MWSKGVLDSTGLFSHATSCVVKLCVCESAHGATCIMIVYVCYMFGGCSFWIHANYGVPELVPICLS